MGNVLRMDKKHVIEGFLGLGWSDRRIQRETGVHRMTVAKYRRALQNRPQVPAGISGDLGQADPQVPAGQGPVADGASVGGQGAPADAPHVAGCDPSFPPEADAPPPLPPPRNAALWPHLSAIQAGLDKGLTAQRIYQDLWEDHGYKGSYDSIKRYLRKVKKKAPRFFERLPTLPGGEGQVDFSQGPMIGEKGAARRSWLFKMTLSFSRHAYEELVFSQDVETFIRCHERAFEFFGGVPAIIKLDNLKSGVLRAHLFEPILNPVYLAFARHWGFAPAPCDPYQPQQKGRVERDIAYTQSNALKGREVKSLSEGNLLLSHWNKHWARQRIHGTTKRQVWQQFVDVERPALRPLASRSFPLFKVGRRKVDVQGHVEVAGNFYSAPYQTIGTYLTVHWNAEEVVLLDKERVLARHRARQGKALASSCAHHRPPHKQPSLEAEENLHLSRARAIGPDTHRLVEKLLSKGEVHAIKKVRGVMSLRKDFPSEVLEEAAGIALTRYNLSYHFVKSLCESILKEGNTQETLTMDHELIRSLAEYQNHVNERMK